MAAAYLLAAAAGRAQPFEPVEIGFRHQASKTSAKHLIETMGAGVALLDYDGDGLLDLFFVNGARLHPQMADDAEPDKSEPAFWNRLYRNRGDWRFEDVTAAAGLAGRGYGMGAAVGDYDNDGDPDLYVTNYGPDILYRNDGGRFTEVPGPATPGWSAGAAFLDYDGDGRLDLFVARYLDWSFAVSRPCGEQDASYCHPRLFGAVSHRLYRNLEDDRFEDVSERVRLTQAPGKGLGVTVADIDGDGAMDVFVANDSVPQQLFLQRGGRLVESGVPSGVAYDADGRTYSGMGTALADYDQDGDLDLFVNALALEGYSLYRQTEPAEFDAVAAGSGLLAATERNSGWGAGFGDFDNDGWSDLFVAQGHVMDDIERSQPGLRYREPLLLLRNLFGRFYDVSAKAGEAFGQARAARGAAIGDLDNDGRLDLAVQVNDGPALLLRNRAPDGNAWIGFELVGDASNCDSIGARVTLIDSEGKRRLRSLQRAGGYLSAGDPRAHFGLGRAAAERVEIVWPGGRKQTLDAPAPNRYHRVVQPPVE